MVCLPKYPPHPTSGYIHFTMQSDLSVALPESLGSGVVPMGTINGGSSLAIPQYGNEHETSTNQSRDDMLPNSQGNEQSLSEPKTTEQPVRPEVSSQLHNLRKNVQMLQQGNEMIVTGLRDAPPLPQSNQEINDDQNIDLGYDSAKDIAAQIERERARTEAQIQVQQREANRLEGFRILKLQQDERRQKALENERVRQEIKTLKQQINKAKEQQALETVRRQCEPTGIELQRLAQLQQEVDKLNSGQRDDFSTMSKELQRHCLALERLLKQQADKREREATENLDRRRWRSKLTVLRVGKGPGTLEYPE
jgi:hypothetical protein